MSVALACGLVGRSQETCHGGDSVMEGFAMSRETPEMGASVGGVPALSVLRLTD